MEEVFKKAEISEGVNVDGENLSNLRFADDVALLNETTKQMEKHLNNLNSESLKVGLKIQRKDKVHDKPRGQRRHTNRSAKNWKSDIEFKYLGHTLKTPLKKKYMPESEQRGAVLEKKTTTRKYSRLNNSPFHLKNK